MFEWLICDVKLISFWFKIFVLLGVLLCSINMFSRVRCWVYIVMIVNYFYFDKRVLIG